MRKFIILILLLLLPSYKVNETYSKNEISIELSDWDLFVHALIYVESRGISDIVGTKNSVGVLQITPIYVKEVNRILGEDLFTLDCRTDRNRSLEMFNIIQNFYNPERDIYKAIKLHNPTASKDYRDKILNRMNKVKQTNYENK